MDYDDFDWEAYVLNYSDLRCIKHKQHAWNHWIQFGLSEGRTKFYKSKKSEIKKYISKKIFESNYTIYITRHMNNEDSSKYWKHNYECIRKLYKKINIIIIDDNSNNKYKSEDEKYKDIQFIYSEYIGRGELLPFHYFYKERPTPYALFIHDSVFIHNEIHKFIYEEPFIKLWSFNSFSWHNKLKDDFIRTVKNVKHKEELLKVYGKPVLWSGTFGGMCVISLECIQKFETRYDFLIHTINNISDRSSRMCLERLLSIMYNVVYTKNAPSLFYDIHGWSFSAYKKTWGFTWQDYQNSNCNADIVKVWSGR
jgi:hypothetical protein